MKTILLLLLLPVFSIAQDGGSKSIKIHFLYGSKPAAGYKQQETKWFGGILGGHVTIEIDNRVIGFVPVGKNHIFPHDRNGHARFQNESLAAWIKDTVSLKYTSVEIPVSDSTYTTVLKTVTTYTNSPPYDYAVFGMRCAAAAYDILSQAGIVKRKRNFGIVCSNFYPKPFRRKVLKLARENNYVVYRHEGRNSRKWEKG